MIRRASCHLPPASAAASKERHFACESPMSHPDDYEIRVHVDFENRLLRPLGICGVDPNDHPHSELLLYGRERCHPDCSEPGCSRCRTRKLYQGSAGDPKGTLTYKLHDEYLYCLRLDSGQPATALLSLTPREQNVEVKELGLLAYWFATCFQRAKALRQELAVEVVPEDNQQTPSEVVASAAADANAKGGIIGGAAAGQPEISASSDVVMEDEDKDTCTNSDRQTSATTGTNTGHQLAVNKADLLSLNSTSRYLPNLRIIYQVKQEKMTITVPDQNQLTRDLEVMLACRVNKEPKLQIVRLSCGQSQASSHLKPIRDVPYTLMVKLWDQGKPVELLDLITERKVLRVQESQVAPKHMNFLMERRVDQRATFVLHVTFDERPIEVDNKWLGEFYLDVDAGSQTLSIGTVRGNEWKTYKVDRLVDMAGPNDDVLQAKKQTVFEGGVDHSTLLTRQAIPIQKGSEYLITVLDPADGTILPTTILSYHKSSLFVKEIKGSEVKLHVTVQRQLPAGTPLNAANANNLATVDEPEQLQHIGSSHLPVVRRSQQDGAFHCPIREGYTKYRILHNATGAGGSFRRARRRSSVSSSWTSEVAAAAATDAAVAAADASSCCYSSGGIVGSSGALGYEDSGLGRNQSSLSESLDSAYRRLHLQQQQQQEQQLLEQQDYNVNLDVDVPKLQARLVAGASGIGVGNGCYIIIEESLTGGLQTRSVPCQLGQAFSVRHWCKYTVKAIDERQVNALFTFRLTDTEVTDIRACNPLVRLSKNVAM